MNTPKRGISGWFIVSLVLGVITLFLCACLGLTVAAWPGSRTPTPPVALATQAITAQAVLVEETAVPTAAPPTATYRPIATTAPRPTETAAPLPTATIDVSAQEYGAWVLPLLLDWKAEIEEVNALATLAADNPYLIIDTTWVGRSNRVVQEIRTTCGKIIAHSEDRVPEGWQEVHDNLVAGAREGLNMADDWEYGVANINGDYIQRATDHLLNSTEYIQRASAALPTN